MTNIEQLRQLLENAFDEGFSAEDIEDLARDIEIEREAEDETEEMINELQVNAADALTDFLFEINYFDEDADFDEQFENLYDALQLIRDGKLNVKVNCNDNGFSYTSSRIADDIKLDNKNMSAFKDILSKYF